VIVFQGGGCGRQDGGEAAPLGASASVDAVLPGMDCGRLVLQCTSVSRSDCCLWPAKHGAVEGTWVHGGHGSGGLDLHVDHGGGHGVHL
jgi:hypothetical protein